MKMSRDIAQVVGLAARAPPATFACGKKRVGAMNATPAYGRQWRRSNLSYWLTPQPAFSLLNQSFFSGGESVLLSSGIHSFPFKLGLPLGLPSTFLGKHGWVQYFCKAALREENGLTHKNQQESRTDYARSFHSLYIPNVYRLGSISLADSKIPSLVLQVFIIMNPIDLNLEPPILAVSGRRCKTKYKS